MDVYKLQRPFNRTKCQFCFIETIISSTAFKLTFFPFIMSEIYINLPLVLTWISFKLLWFGRVFYSFYWLDILKESGKRSIIELFSVIRIDRLMRNWSDPPWTSFLLMFLLSLFAFFCFHFLFKNNFENIDNFSNKISKRTLFRILLLVLKSRDRILVWSNYFIWKAFFRNC